MSKLPTSTRAARCVLICMAGVLLVAVGGSAMLGPIPILLGYVAVLMGGLGLLGILIETARTPSKHRR